MAKQDFFFLIQVVVKIPQRPTSSIFVAIQDGNMAEVLRHLTISQNCTPLCLNNHQESPLHLACRLGYGSIVICLLDHGCPADIVTDAGSPLHSLVKAVKCGYIPTEVVCRKYILRIILTNAKYGDGLYRSLKSCFAK